MAGTEATTAGDAAGGGDSGAGDGWGAATVTWSEDWR